MWGLQGNSFATGRTYMIFSNAEALIQNCFCASAWFSIMISSNTIPTKLWRNYKIARRLWNLRYGRWKCSVSVSILNWRISLHHSVIFPLSLFHSDFVKGKRCARGIFWINMREGVREARLQSRSQTGVYAPPILNMRGRVGEFPLVRTRESWRVQENFSGSLGAIWWTFRTGRSEKPFRMGCQSASWQCLNA